jgi:hypothetical protein
MEIVWEIRRTWWQRLLRKPKQYRTTYIPNARIDP